MASRCPFHPGFMHSQFACGPAYRFPGSPRRLIGSPVHPPVLRFAGPQASFARQGKEERYPMGQSFSESPAPPSVVVNC